MEVRIRTRQIADAEHSRNQQYLVVGSTAELAEFSEAIAVDNTNNQSWYD